MKKLLLVLSLGAFAVGCGGDDDESDDNTDPAGQICEVSSNCPVGEICVDGYCQVFDGCTPDSCPEGQFCDEDFSCKTIEQKCLSNSAGCECHVVNSAGQLEGAGDPQIVLPAGASITVEAMLATVGGAPLPDAAFTMSADGASFSVSDSVLTAEAGQSGEGTLTVTFGSSASCNATLVNLGDAPAAGSVRVYVFDDLTNTPVAGATVVVDTNGDGVDDGGGAVTDETGLAVTGDLGDATAYSATVFAGGYNFLSVAGLSVADNADLSMPLSARSVDPEKGGFTGIMDFVNYEDRYLGGRSAAVKAGIVAGSLPLKALLNFNPDLFIGEITDADCSAEPTPAGCYRVEIRGLVDETLALPGGAVVGLAAQPIKEHFDSVAVPGRRYAWSLGTEVEIADLSGVINVVTPYLSGCSCDQTEGTCDEGEGGVGECSCDLDCGLNIDIGGLYDDIVPLVNSFATGLKGNLPIASASSSDWSSHITGDYSSRSSDERFPKLDNGTGEYGQLVLREAWSDFAAVTAPSLPADPFKEGQQMEAMVALSGVQALGAGFVPLGLGLALDCTEGDCLDREAGGYDGQVNGGQVCAYSLDEAENRCSAAILDIAPEGRLPDGHLPVMRAPAFGGLEGKTQTRRTVILALPLTELLEDASKLRASALIVNEDIGTGISSAISGRTFPTASGVAEALTGRTYTPSADLDAHWITVAGDDVEGGVSTRWNLYIAGDTPFTAPVPPAGTADPFTAMEGTGMVNVTHLGMSLDSNAESLASLATNNGSTLNELFKLVEGIAVVSMDIPAN